MTNPTSNFGWQMPTSSDLVTDLPADFEVFGQAVDTSLADLKGGTTGQVLAKASNTNMDFTWVTSAGDIEGVTAGVGISGGGTTGTVTITNTMATAIDAKGDLVAGTGADTFSRLAIGSNNQVLTADSAAATGMKWASAPASLASYTLITNTGFGSTTSVTFSGLSGYNTLHVLIKNVNSTSNLSTISFRFNGDSTAANYLANAFRYTGASSYSAGNLTGFDNGGDDKLQLMRLGAANTFNGNGFIQIEGANATGVKAVTYAAAAQANSSNAAIGFSGGAAYLGTSVISSITFLSGAGNFDGGEIFIYGSVN